MRGGLPVIPLSLPEPSNSKPRHFAWMSLALCLLGAALFVEKARGLSEHWPAPRSISPLEPVSAHVGPVQFALPENLIATAYQRRLARSPHARFATLRLAMAWPGLTATDMSGQGPEGTTLLIDLDSSPGRESLRARLEPFYRRLARGGELAGPDGLKMLTLSPRGAEATDLVAYDPSEPDGFIVRCRKGTPTGTAVCHRAFSFAAGLELRYRFDQTLLPDWRRLDSAVKARFEALRVGSTAH
ncbi:hypothetical protein [Roseibium sediminicola]|uniref:hypothetical protein n=1 Tax=Roseibium sediminicola TaxID=2933272 RepID=UPI0020047D2B|nr:hypothetical protein [Roseibium sp. CAU 1639]